MSNFDRILLIFFCYLVVIGQIHDFALHIALEQIYPYMLWTLIFTIVYDAIVWYFYGRDPASRSIVPDWNPPSDLTPLECAFIDNDGEPPSNMLITHLIWLAHKKIVTLVQEQKKEDPDHVFYRICVNKDSHPKDTESELFYHSYYLTDLIIDEEPDELLINYMNSVKEKLQKNMKGFYFYTRQKLSALSTLFFPFILCCCAYPQIYAKLTYYAPIVFFGLLELYLIFIKWYGLFVLFIATKIIAFIGKHLFRIHKVFWQIIRRLILLFPSLPLIKSMPSLIPLCLIYIVVTIIFSNTIFQPTRFGQRKKEKIAGLKMFLGTITSSKRPICMPKDSYGLSMEKRLTPEDIQMLFPYAVAFGYEKKWQKKFKNILDDKHDIENLTMMTSHFLDHLNLFLKFHPEIEQINKSFNGRWFMF